MNKVVEIIAQELQIKQSQVESTIKLIDEGNTIPFIARYRKEVTGGLSDEVLRNLGERLTYLRNLESRKEEVIKSIDSQGKLTQEIIKDLENCITLAEVEDIYRPYKQKKRTRATIAKEKGLESLADAIIKQDESIDINKYAEGYINKEKEVNSVEDAINGALDIIAENISDNPEYRKKIKKICYREGIINTKSAKDEKSNYEMYYDFQEKVNRIPSHRILAINRGEKEEFLKVKIDKPEEKILELIQNDIIKNNKSQYAELLNNCILDSFTRLIEPSIDREIRADLTEKAEEQAISVFGKNAKQLLLISPIKGKTVIGFDPAYRTGCKIAVIDETGKVLDYTTIYPTEPQNDIMGAKKELIRLILKDNVDMFAIGNGTASRESEQFVAELIQEIKEKYNKELVYVIVSEAGASVYSASKLATEEYPDINVSIRGAISIARRLQDPLAELVKIDPKAIGVGQYQHDVDQTKLKKSLDRTIEFCVNSVGVNVNTASKHLLTYISGLGPQLAQNIVDYRKENGDFARRTDLLKVPRMGAKAFEQAAGFLRIPHAQNPLDNSAVHPERYPIVEKMADDLNCTVSDLIENKELKKQLDLKNYISGDVGMPTLSDIIAELDKPGRDPRRYIEMMEFDAKVKTIDDLQEGMILNGIVTNITQFGCFVDIGIKENGLVHISQMADRYISNPTEIVSMHQPLKVRVIGIDRERKRIQLSLKDVS